MLNPTPSSEMLDQEQRPYFLWDCDLDIEQFRQRLRSPQPEVRAYFIGKLMRQAKPDDVFEFVSAKTIRILHLLLIRTAMKIRNPTGYLVPILRIPLARVSFQFRFLNAVAAMLSAPMLTRPTDLPIRTRRRIFRRPRFRE